MPASARPARPHGPRRPARGARHAPATRPVALPATASTPVVRIGVLECGWLLAVVAVPLALGFATGDPFELPKQAVLRVILAVSLATAALAGWRAIRDAAAAALASAVGGGRHQAPVADASLALPANGRRWSWPATWQASATLTALLVALTWSVATALSVAPVLSWWGAYGRWEGLWTQLTYLLLFLIAAHTLRSPAQALRLAATVTATATLVSAYALIQALGHDPLHWTTSAGTLLDPTSARVRPVSTFGNPNFLAGFLTMSVFLTAGAALGEARRGWRVCWWAAALLQVAALALTQTRGAWAGSAIGVVILAVLTAVASGRSWRRWLTMAAVIAGGSVLLLWVARRLFPHVALLARAASVLDPGSGTAAVRLTAWRMVGGLLPSRWWLGYGPDTLASVVTRGYAPALAALEPLSTYGVVDRAHNAVLDTLATTGALGGVALTVLGVVVVAAGWRSTVNGTSSGTLPGALAGHTLGPAMLAGLVAHVVEQQFSFDVVGVGFLAWLVAGAVVGCAMPAHAHRQLSADAAGQRGLDRPSRPPAQAIGWLAGCATATLLLLIVLVAGTTVWWEAQRLRADMVYKAGVAAERTGALPQALRGLAASAALWPEEPVYWNELARVHLAAAQTGVGDVPGEYQAAVQAANRALALSPDDARLWSIWGTVAGQAAASLRDPQLAARALEVHAWATTHAPTYWLAWRAAGETALLLGEHATAAGAYQRAVDLYDGDWTTWVGLGDAAAFTGDTARAAEAYRRALRLSPGQRDTQRALDRLLDRLDGHP